jgi:hypothetical protein
MSIASTSLGNGDRRHSPDAPKGDFRDAPANLHRPSLCHNCGCGGPCHALVFGKGQA